MLDDVETYTNAELIISTTDILKVILSSAITEFKCMSISPKTQGLRNRPAASQKGHVGAKASR